MKSISKYLAVFILMQFVNSNISFSQTKQTYGDLIKQKTNVYNVVNTVVSLPIKEVESEFSTWEQFASKQFGTTSLIVDFITLNKLGDFEQTKRVADGKTNLGRIMIGIDFFTKYYYADSPREMEQAWRELGWNVSKEIAQEFVVAFGGNVAALPVMFVAYILEESYSTIIGGYEEQLWNMYDKYYSERLLGKNIKVLKEKMMDGTLVSYMTSPEELESAHIEYTKNVGTGRAWDNVTFRQVMPTLYKKFMKENKDIFQMVAERASKELADKKRKELEKELKNELNNFAEKLKKQKVTFQGIVRDSITKEPVKNATVINKLTKNTFTTNNDGKFDFTTSLFYVYTDNSVSIKVSAEGYITKDVTVEDLKAEGNEEKEILLEPAEGVIEGVVTDAQTNEPVTGAALKLSKLDLETNTNEGGQYSFEKIKPDNYEISVYKEGYEPQNVKVALTVTQKTKEMPKVKKNIKLKPVKVVVTGTVVDIETKKPVENASVKISYNNLKTLTNASGIYSFTDIPKGDYDVTATKIGYNEETVQVSVPEPKPDKKSIEVKVKQISLQPLKTQVKFLSPSNNEMLEGSKVILKALVLLEGNVPLPENNIDLILDNSKQSIEYSPQTGEVISNPSEEILKENENNSGRHTARITVTIPSFGSDKPQQVMEDKISFICGEKPVVTSFLFNEKYKENPEENPMLIGTVYDEGSGIDPAGTKILIDGENINAEVYVQEGGKYADVVYFPKSQPSGGRHTAVLIAKDRAGFETKKSLEFITEGPVLNVVKDSIIIDDTKGNSNGKIDSGETVSLIFNIANTGVVPAEDVSATIYSDSKYINIGQGRCDFGTIQPNGVGFPQGSYTQYSLTALNIGEADKTEPVEVEINVIIKDKGGKTSWKDTFSVRIYPVFYVRLNRLPEPVLDRVQTITGVVSDPNIKTVILTLNSESMQVEVSPTNTNTGEFSQKVSLKAEADSVNTIKVVAVNDKGEKAEDSMEVTVQLPPVTLKVVLTWDTATDVDLWVTDPFGESVGYYHMKSAHNGWLDVDDTSGYGPETFTQEGLYPGTYIIRVNHFNDYDSENDVPSGWNVVVTMFEGTKFEQVFSYSGTLGGTGSWDTVATIVVPEQTNTKSSIMGILFRNSYEAISLPGGPKTPPDGIKYLPQKNK